MRSDRLTQNTLWPMTIGLMLGCIALSLVTLLEPFVPAWQGMYLAAFCGFTAMEASYSYRLYRRDRPLLSRRLPLQLLEVGTLCVARQVWMTVLARHALLQAGVPRFDLTATAKFALASLLILLAWLAATLIAREVDRLGDRVRVNVWFVSPAARLAAWFLAGGLLLFVLSGLTQPVVERELNLPVVSKPGPVLNVLVYVLLGALLLGQVQYRRAHRQHENHHLVLEPGFREDWGQSFGVFAALAAVVVMLALLLPSARTGSLVVGVGEEAGSGVSAALQHLTGTHDGSTPACGQGSLLGARSGPEHGPYIPPLGASSRHRGPPVFPPQRVRRAAPTIACSSLPSRPAEAQGPPVPATTGGGQGLSLGFLSDLVRAGAPVLKALLLWFILLASLLYRIRHGRARRSGDRGMPILPGRLLRDLRSLWIMLLRGARGYALALARPVANKVQTAEGTSALVPQRPSLPPRWPLSPRDRVLRYYGAMLRHAARHGISRSRWQTPREFARAVAQELPESREDVQLLTETFLEARYSCHEIGAGHVGKARTAWRRLRSPLGRAGK